MKYKEIEGCLITKALSGHFDVIAHGCNCQCVMNAGIAPQMAKAFGVDTAPLEAPWQKGNINKLGQIDTIRIFKENQKELWVVNAYTQYGFGKNHVEGSAAPLDYEALTLCMRKINHFFKGKHIGLPGFIGCGLGGGDWSVVKGIIQNELKDCDTTIVFLNKD